MTHVAPACALDPIRSVACPKRGLRHLISVNLAGRLYLYDDTMYAYYPAKQLPAVDDTVEPTFANGIRFEVWLKYVSRVVCCVGP